MFGAVLGDTVGDPDNWTEIQKKQNSSFIESSPGQDFNTYKKYTPQNNNNNNGNSWQGFWGKAVPLGSGVPYNQNKLAEALGNTSATTGTITGMSKPSDQQTLNANRDLTSQTPYYQMYQDESLGNLANAFLGGE